LQVRGFVAQDAFADPLQQLAASRIAQRLVKGNCQDLRCHENCYAEFQPGQLTQPAKYPIEHGMAKPRNSLAVQEPAQPRRVALFFFDKQAKRWNKQRIGCDPRIARRSGKEAFAIRPLPKLELLNGGGGAGALPRSEPVRMAPGKAGIGPRREVSAPVCRCHDTTIKYLLL
jgi:hypothetical protein